MSKRVTTAAVCALFSAVALGAGAAQAQTYNGGGQGTYTYDPCKREQVQRGTVGALLGGGAGAVIGSNAAARNARTEGAIVGGLLGALVGGAVGNKSAACTSTASGYAPATNSTEAQARADASAAALPPPPPRGYYGRDDYTERAYPESGWAYGRRGERYRRAEGRGVDPDGCTLAESPIYMPDGHVQTRFVRVCRDSTGRYAVVE